MVTSAELSPWDMITICSVLVGLNGAVIDYTVGWVDLGCHGQDVYSVHMI